MRTRSSANRTTSAQNVLQPRRTRSSVSRSLGVRSIIPRPSTRAVTLVGSGAARLSRTGRPLGPIRHHTILNSSRKDRVCLPFYPCIVLQVLIVCVHVLDHHPRVVVQQS